MVGRSRDGNMVKVMAPIQEGTMFTLTVSQMEGTEPKVSVLSSNGVTEVQTKPMSCAGLWSRVVSESRKPPKLQSLNSTGRDT